MEPLPPSVICRWERNDSWRLSKIPAIRLFKTDRFRQHPWIRRIATAVGSMYVLEGVNGEPIDWPAGHFGTYFRCTPRRRYENPNIEDLYWLHEIYHLYTWLPGARQVTPRDHESWRDWQRRMMHSEIRAACASECMAHILLPGLREETFEHPIWVDRFLKNRTWVEAVRSGKIPHNEAFKQVKRARRRCLEQPSYDDYVEAQIHGYYQSNLDWVKLWALELVTIGGVETRAFRAVEAHLKAMLYGQMSDQEHAAWLIDACGTESGYGPVPFPSLAAAFEARFKRYYAEFGNQVFLA